MFPAIFENCQEPDYDIDDVESKKENEHRVEKMISQGFRKQAGEHTDDRGDAQNQIHQEIDEI